MGISTTSANLRGILWSTQLPPFNIRAYTYVYTDRRASTTGKWQHIKQFHLRNTPNASACELNLMMYVTGRTVHVFPGGSMRSRLEQRNGGAVGDSTCSTPNSSFPWITESCTEYDFLFFLRFFQRVVFSQKSPIASVERGNQRRIPTCSALIHPHQPTLLFCTPAPNFHCSSCYPAQIFQEQTAPKC